jgi:hypothetical protein
VADHQRYYIAIYKYDDFLSGTATALDFGVVQNNEVGNMGFEIDPAGCEIYLIYVTGIHGNTFPSAHYILTPWQHFYP